MRPSRAETAPPARPNVRSTRVRARLASRIATIPRIAATGTATPAWSRRRSFLTSVTRIARGIESTASTPRTTEKPAARFRRGGPLLLLDVGAAIGCGRDRAADQPGDRDQG